MEAFAVVMTYLPDTEECLYTPFSQKHYEDPLAAALLFKRSGKDANDFPGSLWAVTGNDEAHALYKNTILKRLGIDDE